MLTAEDVHSAYYEILCRPADPAGLEHFVGREFGYDILLEHLRASKEYKTHILPLIRSIENEPKPRILTFGAFGNGNIGDDIQAVAVADLIETSVAGATCWSTSFFLGQYPGNEQRKLKPGAIYSTEILSLFDMIVIGGGGLLAHPHHPLDDSAWVARLKVPVILMGVGANGSFVGQCEALLRYASFVGCRDALSLKCVSRYTTKCGLILDPVLLSRMLAPSKERVSPEYGTCWVVRDPIDRTIAEVKRCVREGDVVVGIEPSVDVQLTSVFPDMVLTNSLDRFCDIASKSKMIISMRYHGVIIGLRLGIPSYALRINKAEYLLSLLGLDDLVISSLETLPTGGGHISDSQIEQFRSIYQIQMRSLFASKNTALVLEP